MPRDDFERAGVCVAGCDRYAVLRDWRRSARSTRESSEAESESSSSELLMTRWLDGCAVFGREGMAEGVGGDGGALLTALGGSDWRGAGLKN